MDGRKRRQYPNLSYSDQNTIALSTDLTAENGSEDRVLLEDGFERGRVKDGVVWDQPDDVCQVRKEVALVLVREHGGDADGVEFNVLVVHADKVDVWILRHERHECVFDDLGDEGL